MVGGAPVTQNFCDKIGADFFEIKDRKYPEFAPVYEKLQIFELGQEMKNDWNIFIDADTLVHPDCFDFTTQMKKDTVAHNGKDFAPIRWKMDRYFLRDGRNIGSCNWFAVASDWCIDLWHPLDDITREEAIANINPTAKELGTIIEASHLIDDYTLSRNIAKYGLKHTTLRDIFQPYGFQDGNFFWHQYTIPIEQKVQEMKKVLKVWGIA